MVYGCDVYVCPDTDTRMLDLIAHRLKMVFTYTPRCMSSGTRDACLVMSPDGNGIESDAPNGLHRGCTDMNYVRMRGNESERVYADIVDVFGGHGPRVSMCAGEADAGRTWCFYARMDDCVRLEADELEMSVVEVVMLAVCFVLVVVVVRWPVFLNPAMIASAMAPT